MIYLKYFILFNIFLINCIIGILLSKKYKNRVNELRIFKEDIKILETRIRFTYEPIKEIFKYIYKNNNNISNIFKYANIYLEEKKDFKTSWELAVNNSKSKLSLKEEDLDIIKGIGNFLRKN